MEKGITTGEGKYPQDRLGYPKESDLAVSAANPIMNQQKGGKVCAVDEEYV